MSLREAATTPDALRLGPPPARQAVRGTEWPGAHQRRWAREVSVPGRCRQRHRRCQERRGVVVGTKSTVPMSKPTLAAISLGVSSCSPGAFKLAN